MIRCNGFETTTPCSVTLFVFAFICGLPFLVYRDVSRHHASENYTTGCGRFTPITPDHPLVRVLQEGRVEDTQDSILPKMNMRARWEPSRVYLATLISALLFTCGSAWLPHNGALTRRALPRSTTVQLAKPSTLKMSLGESPVQGYSVVLLAGGVGSRMKASMPKQFLQLRGKTVLMHSIELFLSLDGVKEVLSNAAASFWRALSFLPLAHLASSKFRLLDLIEKNLCRVLRWCWLLPRITAVNLTTFSKRLLARS